MKHINEKEWLKKVQILDSTKHNKKGYYAVVLSLNDNKQCAK
jgi:hypothetical protein